MKIIVQVSRMDRETQEGVTRFGELAFENHKHHRYVLEVRECEPSKRRYHLETACERLMTLPYVERVIVPGYRTLHVERWDSKFRRT